MKEKQKYFYLWCFSIFLIVPIFVTLIMFFKRRTTILLIVLAAFIVLFYVLYTVSMKKLKLKNNYTLIDAMRFYKKCGNGLKTSSLTEKKRKKFILETAQKFDFCKELNFNQLSELYDFGKKYSETLKIPDLLICLILFKNK